MANVQYICSISTAIIELLLFSGLIFGWSSITSVLMHERFFSHLCLLNDGNSSEQGDNLSEATNNDFATTTLQTNTSTEVPCTAQDESINFVFTIASFMLSLSTLPNGYLFDKFGTWISRFVAISLITLGSLMLSFASVESSILLYPAMCGFAIGGILLIVTNMQLANLFPRFKSSLITLMSGSLDSSSVVFLLIKVAYDSGISFNAVFIFITVCTMLLWLRTVFLLPRKHIPIVLPKDGYKYGLHDCTKFTHSKDSQTTALHDVNFEVVNQNIDSDGDGKTNSKPISYCACICTLKFWTNLFHFSILQLRNYFFFSSFYTWLTNMLPKDSDQIDVYLNAFGVCQFFGIFCAPLNGLLIDGVKYFKRKSANKESLTLTASFLSASVTSTWGVLFSLFLLFPNPQLQYVSFILQVVFRSFLYGGNFSFIALLFPSQHFGKLYGMTMTLAGFISLLQYPLYSLVLRSFDGDFYTLNIIFLVLCALTWLHPLCLFLSNKTAKTGVLTDKKEFIPGVEVENT